MNGRSWRTHACFCFASHSPARHLLDVSLWTTPTGRLPLNGRAAVPVGVRRTSANVRERPQIAPGATGQSPIALYPAAHPAVRVGSASFLETISPVGTPIVLLSPYVDSPTFPCDLGTAGPPTKKEPSHVTSLATARTGARSVSASRSGSPKLRELRGSGLPSAPQTVEVLFADRRRDRSELYNVRPDPHGFTSE